MALLFRTLDALRVFDLPFALTQGSNGTTTLSLYSYNELTRNRLIGEGSAIAVLTFVIVMVVAFLYIRFVGRKHPGDDGGRVMSKKRQERRNRILLWIAVVAIMVFCLFPFYWLINTSLEDGPGPVERRPGSRPTRRWTTTRRSSTTRTSRPRCATA